MSQIDDLIKMQREALLSLDAVKIIAYMRTYHIEIPDDPEVFWGMIHKARIAVDWMPEPEKEISRKWLIEHHMKPYLSTDAVIQRMNKLSRGGK